MKPKYYCFPRWLHTPLAILLDASTNWSTRLNLVWWIYLPTILPAGCLLFVNTSRMQKLLSWTRFVRHQHYVWVIVCAYKSLQVKQVMTCWVNTVITTQNNWNVKHCKHCQMKKKSCKNGWLVVSAHLKNVSQNGNLPQIGMKIQ